MNDQVHIEKIADRFYRERAPWWKRLLRWLGFNVSLPYDAADREAISEGWKEPPVSYGAVHEFGRSPIDTGTLRASIRVAPKKRRKPARKARKAKTKKRRNR